MMLKRNGFLLLVLSLLLSATVRTAQADDASDALKAPAAPLNESVLSVPGDPERPVTLQVTVYMLSLIHI